MNYKHMNTQFKDILDELEDFMPSDSYIFPDEVSYNIPVSVNLGWCRRVAREIENLRNAEAAIAQQIELCERQKQKLMENTSSAIGTIQIDRDIPMPCKEDRLKRVFPFDKMNVGDSFFVPGRTANSMRGAKQGAERRTRYMFKCLSIDGGVRVWRIA